MPWDNPTNEDWQDSTDQQVPPQGQGVDPTVRLIKTPVFSRTPIRRGIDYRDDYGAFNNGGAPTIPYPIRSSLAQLVTIYESFTSRYFSWIRRGSPEQLDQMGIGHLFTRVHHLPYMTPSVAQSKLAPKPTIRKYGTGRVAQGGVMGAQPRFNRALKAIDYAYKPPVYGENE